MTQRTRNKPGRKAKKPLQAHEVQGGKYVEQIIDLLRPLRGHCEDPKRRLHYDEFCAWLLLYFFTPVLDSMRGLQQASDIATIKRKLKLPRFSLGSFSEAAQVFDPELLLPIIEEISGSLGDIESEKFPPSLSHRPVAVDGTLLEALPSMVWALWRDDEHRAAKLHLQFDLRKGTPEKPVLSHGQSSETQALRQNLQAGRLYIADRGYFDFDLLSSILAADSSFVTRVRNNIVYETIEEKPLSESDKQQGIEADLIVRAGCHSKSNIIDQPLRLVRIQVADGPTAHGAGRVDSKSKLYRKASSDHTLMLLSDQLDLDVSHIALLYRNRWQIELFFRWFKKVLQADRLLSVSENGLTLVVYCALIASLLVSLWTGRKPTKRTFEMLCFYFSGMADEQDVLTHIERLQVAEKNK